MPNETSLIATIAAGLGLAFVFGFAATRVRLPPLVGYLFAGIVVGPFTPGYVADVPLAAAATGLSQVGELSFISRGCRHGARHTPGGGKKPGPRRRARFDNAQRRD